MPNYLHIPCPNCHHVLRIREQYVGIEVTCMRCNHSFLVQAPSESANDTPTAITAPVDHSECERRLADVTAELNQIRQQLDEAVAESQNRAETIQRLNDECAVQAAKTLEHENLLEQTRQERETALVRIHELEGLHDQNLSANSRHNDELSRIIAERDQAETRARSAEEQLRDLQDQIDEAPTVLDQQACEQKLADLHGELDQLRRELSTAREDNQSQSDTIQRLNDKCAVQTARTHELDSLLAETRQQLDLASAQIQKLEVTLSERAEAESQRNREFGRISAARDQAEARAQEAERALSAPHDQPINAAESANTNATDQRVAELNDQLQRAANDNAALRAMIRGLGISLD